jgi:outer membrane lipoprotein
MKNIVVLFALTLLLQGCTYAISRGMTAKADKTITFEMLQADPDSFKGKILILGGTISQITNTKKGTILEVVQRPLDYWGKPKRTSRTGGSFLVFYPGYLNTFVYEPGREITVAAEVEGTRSKALGEIEYSYPVVVAKEIKLWEREPSAAARPKWTDPLYDPSNPDQRY